MADDKGSQEKTEDATPKRMRESRKKGQVAKSKDLTTVFVLIGVVASVLFFGREMFNQLGDFMVYALSQGDTANPSVEQMGEFGWNGFGVMVRASAAPLIASFVVALVVAFLQVGGMFSLEPLKPQLKKLNPIEGAKNMLKMKTFIELGKNIIKMSTLMLLAYVTINKFLRPFLLSLTLDVQEGVKVGGLMLAYYLLLVFIVFILIAIIDVFLQRKEHKKEMKMTKDEVKREYKEDEGDPLIKGQRKQLHQEMAMSDVSQQVKSSDVVVTNPTHLAIAIKYDSAEMVAPQIMAKGQRLYAQMIREMAEDYGVPIMRNVPLAWALIELEVGDEVPEEIYQAVAEILAFVYRMKAEQDYEQIQERRPGY
jgi:flagellar biosynthesis protein FlhB